MLNELQPSGTQAALKQQIAAAYLATGDGGAAIPWLKGGSEGLATWR